MEKPSFNLIDREWLFVQYNNGQVKQVSIKTALRDEDIKDLAVPVYHGFRCHPYTIPAYIFLPLIVMAAYFKPGDFPAGNESYLKELADNGTYTETVKNYLEKYHDRFDLFGDHPFLQNLELKDFLENQEKYIPKICYAAPSENGFMTGELNNLAVRNDGNVYKGLRMSMDELAYSLLYTQSIAQCSDPAHCYGSLLRKASVFVFPKGKNLQETIRLNCLSLIYSNQPNEESPDTMFDRPVWEFETPSQGVRSYERQDIGKNILFSSFLPSYPVLLGRELDEDGYVKQAAVGKKEDVCKMLGPKLSGKSRQEQVITTKAWLDTIEETYVMYCPWAQVYKKTEKEKRQEKISFHYSFYNTDKSAHLLGIEITGKTPEREACIILNTAQSKTASKIAVYYRIINAKHPGNRLQSGVVDLSHDFFSLLDEKKHKAAEMWARMYSEMFNALRAFSKQCKAEHMTQELADWAEQYFSGCVMQELISVSPAHEDPPGTEDLLRKWFKDIRREILSISNRALESEARQSPIKCGEAYRLLLRETGIVRNSIFGSETSTSSKPKQEQKGDNNG